MKRKLTVTKRRLPALWECGGGSTNTGHATIVAGPEGEALRPLYIRRGGSLANREHALFVVSEGCYVVDASHHRGDFEISVSMITEIVEAPCQYMGEKWAPPDFIPEKGVWYNQPSPLPPSVACPDCGAKNYAPGPNPDGGEELYWLCQGFRPVAKIEILCHFSQGQWDTDPAELAGIDISAAVEAATKKALCYHCRETHYASS